MPSAPIVCLAGPTASGKSASALALAQHLPIEIIHVDSATIYRGMNIGTAKPSAEEQAQVPQHLLDIRDPAQSYSAADFYHDVLQLIPAIVARGRLPLLVGGTMMYYHTLRNGLHALPQAQPALRAELLTQAQTQGWHALHQRLATLDPPTANRLSPNDTQRIQRALEIILSTGRPLSEHFAQQKQWQSPYQWHTISLEPSDRTWLHERIAQRFHTMMTQGLLDEVRALYQRSDLHPDLPAIRCVGYRQLWAHLAGEVPLTQAIDQAIAATRQLAKRQLTWLRNIPERQVVDCMTDDALNALLEAFAQSHNLG